ncbi:substrate-binding periplasmic protein [Sphingomonas sp. 37zxx]|uniref:substrate-binding periplasmic protein n=1 Tax=Sphingomonas sp. 37zxx TaxID=1550073 RepID=UPI00053BE171|nr:transporter substrate-binding domain-containing protein [Sphingomonas sp. 37zxx]
MPLSRRGLLAGAGATMVAGMIAPLRAAPLARIRELGMIRVAVYRDFAPWAYSETPGNPRGIDVDLGKLIASKLGVRAEVIEYLADESADDDLRNMVWRGSLIGMPPGDVMMHAPYDRTFGKRNDRAVLVAPYYRESFAMVCNRETTDCEIEPASLAGKRLVAELDSIPDFYLAGAFGGVLRSSVSHKLTGADAVAAVIAGQADAAVATRAQAEGMLAKQPPGGRAVIRKSSLPAMASPGWNVGMAVKDNSRDLGDAIERIVEDATKSGEIRALFSVHGVQHRAPILV